MYLISDMQTSLVVVIFFVFLHKLLIRAGKSIQRKRVNKHQPSLLDKTIKFYHIICNLPGMYIVIR